MRREALTIALLLPLLVAPGCAPIQAPPQRVGLPAVEPVFGENVPLITLILWHAKDLPLTPDQVRILQALRTDFQREADLQTAELQRIELDLQRLLSRQEVDLVQVEARVRRVEAIRTNLRLSRIKTVERAKATLTPEQRQKLQPLIRGGP